MKPTSLPPLPQFLPWGLLPNGKVDFIAMMRGRAVRSARLAHNQEATGSNPVPATISSRASIAQSAEHLLCKQEVVDSTPTAGSTSKNGTEQVRSLHSPEEGENLARYQTFRPF